MSGSDRFQNSIRRIAASAVPSARLRTSGGLRGHLSTRFSLVAIVGVGLCLLLVVGTLPAQAAPTKWRVTFTETGIPEGTQWSVVLNGVLHVSDHATITFYEPVGTYAFQVRHHAGYHTSSPSGTVTVAGVGGATVHIAFTSLGTASTIDSNFNGTSIPGGDWIWFNSVVKPKSTIPSAGLIVRAVAQAITLTLPNGSTISLGVPDAKITYGPTTTTGNTTFDGRWLTTVPNSFGDNVFLSGLAYHVPAGGLPGGINSVSWSATFSVNSNVRVSFQWQWAAAVYSNFTNHYDQLKVKPLHSTSLDGYPNGDQAGTPEAFTAHVVGGARGGGGANCTGSYSATVSVSPKFVFN